MLISPKENEALYYLIFKDERPEDITYTDTPGGQGEE
jgi:hypothetical protein